MPKLFPPIYRLLQVRLTIYFSLILSFITIFQFFASYGYYDYEHLPQDSVNKHLYQHVNPKIITKKFKPNCKYDDILKSTKSINAWEVFQNQMDKPTGVINGSYVPEDCNPLYSVAILVTHRNRKIQLDIFLEYMHKFLRKQNIHYKIYVIEQQDDKQWNKGLLYNVGAKHAIADKFSCLIFHDVDLLPLDESNLYICLKQPRHMSASIDKFRFVLIYKTLVGGVLSMTADHYKEINGFSNKFQGWGGEDDDLARRILVNKLSILRFPHYMSRYTMLVHSQEKKNIGRYSIMTENEQNSTGDGLNSVHVNLVNVETHHLFTLIGVKT